MHSHGTDRSGKSFLRDLDGLGLGYLGMTRLVPRFECPRRKIDLIWTELSIASHDDLTLGYWLPKGRIGIPWRFRGNILCIGRLVRRLDDLKPLNGPPETLDGLILPELWISRPWRFKWTFPIFQRMDNPIFDRCFSRSLTRIDPTLFRTNASTASTGNKEIAATRTKTDHNLAQLHICGPGA